MRRFLTTIATLVLSASMAFAQEQSLAEQCVSLAARGDVATLHQVYDTLQTPLPDHVRLYCQLAFARAKGDNREIIDIADTLETRHSQHFESKGLLALCEEKCEALRQLGEYPTLQTYTKERLAKFRADTLSVELIANTKTYHKIATLFADRKPMVEEWESPTFALPISRDWPLLIPARVGANDDYPFFIDTSSQFSVISTEDAANWGITIFGEGVALDTPIGIVKAYPVMVDAFTIGLLTLRNVMLFVVGNDVDAPYNRCIGNDLLRRLQKVEINDQQIVVTQQSNMATSANPTRSGKAYPLCFNAWGGIDLQRKTENGYLRYTLDTSMPDDADDNDYRIKGVHFLKTASSVIIDFTKMRLIPNGGREYTPRSVKDYIDSEDYFELLRNEAALSFTASEDEMAQIGKALDKALTPPDVSTLSPTIQAAIVTPEKAETFNREPHQLLVTSRGLIYERAEGKHLKTMVVTDKMATTHKIDIENLQIY